MYGPLPDEHELRRSPGMVMVGVALWVEVFDGQRYWTCEHGNPNLKSSLEAKRASEMLGAGGDVMRRVRHHIASP